MNIFLILLAAGESKRLKSAKAKPYITINNKTLKEHIINKLSSKMIAVAPETLTVYIKR